MHYKHYNTLETCIITSSWVRRINNNLNKTDGLSHTLVTYINIILGHSYGSLTELAMLITMG